MFIWLNSAAVAKKEHSYVVVVEISITEIAVRAVVVDIYLGRVG